MKLLIGGSPSKIFHLEEFQKALTKLNVECKLVIDTDICNGFPSRKISDWFQNQKKFDRLISDFKSDVVFVDRQPVTDLYKYLSASSVLLMPFPWTEHYAYYMSPLKMFEYMAMKRPIVASKLPSIEEVLRHKYNAILCENDNPKDLSKKVDWALKNDCSKLVL